MSEDTNITAIIYRFDPSRDSKPHYEKYEVPKQKGMRVMDVLEQISDIQGHSVAFRWFCGVKRCGTCAVNMNGKPILACWEEAPNELVLEPLSNFKVIRDLVVDRSEIDDALVREGNVLERREPYTKFPEKVTHNEMKQAYPLIRCIDCLVCIGACPTMEDGVRNHFKGPYSIVQAAKIDFDPRDRGNRKQEFLNLGLEECDECGECSKACPNSIDVLEQAIRPARRKHDIGRKLYAVDPCHPTSDEQKRTESFLRASADLTEP
ncbi:MAG: 4Fe-4S dicluster domain-containing protein [Nitrososphaerota archaeon]|nr:4Fe-4S dicluster domain-containing protein [Nitrososphaerota archaeon]